MYGEFMNQEKCVFCKMPDEEYIIKGRNNYIIPDYTGDAPPLGGRTLRIVPYRHVESLKDLTDKERKEYFNLFKIGVKVLEKLGSKGFITHTINMERKPYTSEHDPYVDAIDLIENLEKCDDFHTSTLIIDCDYSKMYSFMLQSTFKPEKCYICEPENNHIVHKDNDFTTLSRGRYGEEGDDYDDNLHLVLAPTRHIKNIEEVDDRYFDRLMSCMNAIRQQYNPPGIDIRFHICDTNIDGHFHSHIHSRWYYYRDKFEIRGIQKRNKSDELLRMCTGLQEALLKTG